MYKLVKTAIACVAALLVAEIVAATYVNVAHTADAPKIAAHSQCMKNISTNDAFFIPCSLLTKYDMQAWVEAGQEI
jgi:Na+-translocating ferredoxin:NAD+ oxidoreductase RnfG subunit